MTVRTPTADEQTLGATFREAMRLRDAMRADGATPVELDATMERTIRVAWPQTRVWKYLCNECSDTGWMPSMCTPKTRCGRPFRLPNQRGDDYTGQGPCESGHTYVQACICEQGDLRRRNLRKERTHDDVLQHAAKVSKPSRFGR